MIDPELGQRLTELEQKIEATYRVAASARKLFLWTIIVSVALFVLPLIGLAFVLPGFINSLDLSSIGQ